MTDFASAASYQDLRQTLMAAKSPRAYAATVVNAPYDLLPLQMAELFLGFICLYLVEGDEVRFLAASDTEYYQLAIKDYPAFDPNDFRLPLGDTSNDIVRAVVEQKPIHSVDWNNVKRHEAAPETVRLNQATSGIATAYIYPFKTQHQRGALMFNYYQYAEAIGQAQLDFMQHYTDLVSSALINP
jgi:hypothetical protein